MSQPSVIITELDGALGVREPSDGKLALVGVASAGTANSPATYARVTDVVAAFTSGPLVEAAAHYIERYGKPVILVRTGQTVVGIEGTLDATLFTGTSVPTLDTTDPNDDYEAVVKFITGGTIGVAGITYQYSLDGGRTYSPVTALGTATTIVLPGTGGVNLDFAAGTIVAGSILSFRTTAPNWNSSELGTALDALAASAVAWELCEIVGPIDGTSFDTIETKFAAMFAAGKYRAWVGNTRMPTLGESEATYLAAMNTIFSAKAALFGNLCAGACKLTSSVSGRKYKRPVAFVVAGREASSSEEVNTADVNLGPLVGVSIRDDNGNVYEHDESVNPGLDDGRFTVLRTWDGLAGVYINRSRLFSAAGSDYRLLTHRRVINLAHAVLRAYFIRRCNKPIRVNATTGYILESEAQEIENGARQALEAVLTRKPKASAVSFTLSRTDNLLSTSTMNGDGRVTPLAYPETIALKVGFTNPALQVVSVN